jgi:hypothetical protein
VHVRFTAKMAHNLRKFECHLLLLKAVIQGADKSLALEGKPNTTGLKNVFTYSSLSSTHL